MNEPAFTYSIRLPFPAGPVNPDWLGAKFLATLDALTQIDSNIFSGWEVLDRPAMKADPLAAARSCIGHYIYSDDLDLPESKRGYAAAASTTIGGRSRRMTLAVYTWMGVVWLNAVDPRVPLDPAIVTYPLFRNALLAINMIWQQPWACAQAFRSRTVDVPIDPRGSHRTKRLPMIPADPTFPESIFHAPWLAYLSAPLAAGVKLPPEIQTERVADGGLLMVATKERLDPDMLDHARRARILAETLIAQTGNPGPTTQ